MSGFHSNPSQADGAYASGEKPLENQRPRSSGLEGFEGVVVGCASFGRASEKKVVGEEDVDLGASVISANNIKQAPLQWLHTWGVQNMWGGRKTHQRTHDPSKRASGLPSRGFLYRKRGGKYARRRGGPKPVLGGVSFTTLSSLQTPPFTNPRVFRKNPHGHKNRIGTSTPFQNSPPLKRGILWAWGFCSRKSQKMPGAHKIGAAISGPRIAGRKIMDIRLLLNFRALAKKI